MAHAGRMTNSPQAKANIGAHEAEVRRIAKQVSAADARFGPGSTQFQRAMERLSKAKHQLHLAKECPR